LQDRDRDVQGLGDIQGQPGAVQKGGCHVLAISGAHTCLSVEDGVPVTADDFGRWTWDREPAGDFGAQRQNLAAGRQRDQVGLGMAGSIIRDAHPQ